MCREMAQQTAEDDPATALQVFLLTSMFLSDRGDWERARDGYGLAIANAERSQNKRRQEESSLQLGWVMLNMANFSGGLELCEEMGEHFFCSFG